MKFDFNFDRILSQFNGRWKLFVWGTVVFIALIFLVVKAIVPIADSYFKKDVHSCAECRAELHLCNQDFTSMASLVRELERLSIEEKMIEADMDRENRMASMQLERVQRVEEVPRSEDTTVSEIIVMSPPPPPIDYRREDKIEVTMKQDSIINLMKEKLNKDGI